MRPQARLCQLSLLIERGSRQARFDKMHLGSIPILTEDALLAVQVELIHTKYDGDILRLPLFFIRIAVLHPKIAHDAAATRIVPVVRRRHIRNALFAELFQDLSTCLTHDPAMPKLLAQRIAQIAALLRPHIDVADGDIVLPQADGIKAALFFLVEVNYTIKCNRREKKRSSYKSVVK